MKKKYLAEFVGTFLLISVIVGSGIMGVNLSNGNDALALLANAISTGSILYVIITLFSPVSGASFNPAITFLDYLEKKIDSKILIIYWLNQILGGLVGVFFIHFIFELEIVQFSNNDRYGVSIWMSELVSTLTLLLVVKVGSKNKDNIALLVALLVTSGYWFTSSTFFVNPAVTIARSFTDTFSGINPFHAPFFILTQFFAVLIFYKCSTINFLKK